MELCVQTVLEELRGHGHPNKEPRGGLHPHSPPVGDPPLSSPCCVPANRHPSYTRIYLYIFLAVDIRAQALAAGSIPCASRCTAPGRIFGMGGLHAACRCMRAHMHGQTDGQRCPLHLTIQFRLSFNPVTLADEGWGSAGIGQHAAGGASVGLGGMWLDPGAPNCAWRWGRGREHKHGGMEGTREGAGQVRVEEESDGERGWWGHRWWGKRAQGMGGHPRSRVVSCVAALLLHNGNGDGNGDWVRDTSVGDGG